MYFKSVYYVSYSFYGSSSMAKEKYFIVYMLIRMLYECIALIKQI